MTKCLGKRDHCNVEENARDRNEKQRESEKEGLGKIGNQEKLGLKNPKASSRLKQEKTGQGKGGRERGLCGVSEERGEPPTFIQEPAEDKETI